MTTKTFLAACGISLLSAATASAQSSTLMTPSRLADTGVDLIIELGVSADIRATFEGSSKYNAFVLPTVDIKFLDGPGWLKVDNLQKTAFSFAPSIVVLDARIARDHDQLLGMNDRATTYELGGRIGYDWGGGELYAVGRHAFGGGTGFVGEVGVNAIFRPVDGLELKVGPTLSAATSDYMKSSFGVSADESIASGGRLFEYAPEGGIKSVGVSAKARYEFIPDTFLNIDASYMHLVGSAAESPIVKLGNQDQGRVVLGISRQFSLDLY